MNGTTTTSAAATTTATATTATTTGSTTTTLLWTTTATELLNHTTAPSSYTGTYHNSIVWVALSSFAVLALVLGIGTCMLLPKGYCSKRARWLRKMQRRMATEGRAFGQDLLGVEEVEVSDDEETQKSEPDITETKKSD